MAGDHLEREILIPFEKIYLRLVPTTVNLRQGVIYGTIY